MLKVERMTSDRVIRCDPRSASCDWRSDNVKLRNPLKLVQSARLYVSSISSLSCSLSVVTVRQENLTRCITSTTNKVLNSSAKRRAPHQNLPRAILHYRLHLSTDPCHPEITIPMDRCSDGLLAMMANNRPQTRTEQSQRMSFIARHPTMTTN